MVRMLACKHLYTPDALGFGCTQMVLTHTHQWGRFEALLAPIPRRTTHRLKQTRTVLDLRNNGF
eukprot:6211788-Pleurochrysis_carterae.AAC.2